jgi:transposase-like protein
MLAENTWCGFGGPMGSAVPLCKSDHSWFNARRGLLECADCHHQSSATTGTIFDSTPLPLTLWFRAMWLVTGQKNGLSALGLQRQLGMKRYETVWTMLHKLRRATVRADRDRLSGRVEVDETYIGSPEEGTRGRQVEAKSLIVIAAQENGRGIGRIRIHRIADASADSLIPFITESIEPGSVVHTDSRPRYFPVERNGYLREVGFLHGNKKTPSRLLPRVHLVVSLLKQCGWSVPIKGLSVAIIRITTCMSLPSASAAGLRGRAGSSSIASRRRPRRLSLSIGSTWRTPSGSMATTYSANRSQPDSQITN